MKKLLFLSALVGIVMVVMTSSTTVKYPSVKSKSFKTGEKLRYRVTYGFVDAGEAILTVTETSKKGAGSRPLYHVKGEGRTLGGFNMFFKVEDVYESYIDKS